jgi:hypothetical protein
VDAINDDDPALLDRDDKDHDLVGEPDPQIVGRALED